MQTITTCLLIGAVLGVYFGRDRISGRKGVMIGVLVSMTSAALIMASNFFGNVNRIAEMTLLQVAGTYLGSVLILGGSMSVAMCVLLCNIAKIERKENK